MGGVKQRWLEMEARHLSSVPDKHICPRHIEDRTINNFIKKNYTAGYCDYCRKDVKVVPLEDLMEFIMDGILQFYEDAANFMSYNSREGGYLGEIYTPDEVIQEHIELNAAPFEVIEDIVDSIEGVAWAQPDLYCDNIKDDLEYQWAYFKEIIKHKSRYLFGSVGTGQLKAMRILRGVGRLISELKIVKKIPKGTRLYRCRQHGPTLKIKEFSEITAPSNNNAIYPNRFSPSGIAMFYAAFDTDTAILETVSRTDKTRKYITIGEFETLEDEWVVDFSRLPKIPSIFGIKSKKRYYLLLYLYSFVRDITKPVEKDGKEHTEYVPTQVVTEFFRYPFNKNKTKEVSGIVYPSAQKEGSSACVFFWDNIESSSRVKLNNLQRKKIKT